MSEPKRFEFEFVRRTMQVIRALETREQWAAIGFPEDRAVTLLLNCMQGTVVYLWEAILSQNANHRRGRHDRDDLIAGPPVTRNLSRELRGLLGRWPAELDPAQIAEPPLVSGTGDHDPLSSPSVLLRFLRHAVSHADLEVGGESGVITSLRFVSSDANRAVRLPVNWLREFVCYVSATWLALDPDDRSESSSHRSVY